MKPNLQPIRGFRDLYPEDKAVQNYIFEKIKETALRAYLKDLQIPEERRAFLELLLNER